MPQWHMRRSKQWTAALVAAATLLGGLGVGVSSAQADEADAPQVEVQQGEAGNSSADLNTIAPGDVDSSQAGQADVNTPGVEPVEPQAPEAEAPADGQQPAAPQAQDAQPQAPAAPAAQAEEPEADSDLTRAASTCKPGTSTISQCFPDKNLASAVAAELNVAVSSKLTSAQAAKVRSVSIIQAKVTSLQGIQVLTNLTRLYASSNSISDLSPLSGLTKLTELYLNYNKVSNLSPLRKLSNLTQLSIIGNTVSDLSPISGLTNLTELQAGSNKIANISALRGLTNVTYLSVMDNKIVDISPLRGLTKLQTLYVSSNKIVDVSPLSGLTHFTTLFVSSNEIKDISPLKTMLTAMKPYTDKYSSLDVSYNHITNIETIQGKACQGKFAKVYTDGQRPLLKRLSGNLRYDTAGQVVGEAFPGKASTVVLASGGNYPDALAASGLAGALNAPVMLTDASSLSAQAKSQITRLKPSRVIIVGGTSAVSKGVEQAVSKLVPAKGVSRIAGSTRYDTSAQIMSKGKSSLGAKWASTAVVTTGGGFADALSMSPYAYAKHAPVLLADSKTGLSQSVINTVKSGKFTKVVVVGGTAAVPAKVESQLKSAGVKSVDRVQGKTRYATSLAAAKYGVADKTLGFSSPVFATGGNFPDALAGSSLAGSKKSMLILVNSSNRWDSDVYNAYDWMSENRTGIKESYILGGTSAVSKSISSDISSFLYATEER